MTFNIQDFSKFLEDFSKAESLEDFNSADIQKKLQKISPSSKLDAVEIFKQVVLLYSGEIASKVSTLKKLSFVNLSTDLEQLKEIKKLNESSKKTLNVFRKSSIGEELFNSSGIEAEELILQIDAQQEKITELVEFKSRLTKLIDSSEDLQQKLNELNETERSQISANLKKMQQNGLLSQETDLEELKLILQKGCEFLKSSKSNSDLSWYLALHAVGKGELAEKLILLKNQSPMGVFVEEIEETYEKPKKLKSAIKTVESDLALCEKLIEEFGPGPLELFKDDLTSLLKIYRDSPELLAKILKLNWDPSQVRNLDFSNETIIDIANQLPPRDMYSIEYLCGRILPTGEHVSRQQRNQLTPFLKWMITAHESKNITREEMGSLVEKGAALAIYNPELAELLYELPEKHLHVWKEVLDRSNQVDKLKIDDVIIAMKKLDIDPETLVRFPWNNVPRLKENLGLLADNPVAVRHLMQWMSFILGEEVNVENLEAQLSKLSSNDRLALFKLLSLPGPEYAALALEFGQILPYRMLNFINLANLLDLSLLQRVISLAKNHPEGITEFLSTEDFTSASLISFFKLNTLLGKEWEKFYLISKGFEPAKMINIFRALEDPKTSAAVKDLIVLGNELNIPIVGNLRLNAMLSFVTPFFVALMNDPIYRQHWLNTYNTAPPNLRGKENQILQLESLKNMLILAEKDPGLCKEIVILSSGNPYFHILCQNCVLDPSKYETVQKLIELNRKNAPPSIIKGLSDLIKFKEIGLADELIDHLLEEPEGKETGQLIINLLDMCRAGSLEDVKELLKLKKQEPGNPVYSNLLKLASSTNAGIIRAVLNLDQSNHPKLVSQISSLEISKERQFPPLIKNLLVLIEQDREEFAQELEEAFFVDSTELPPPRAGYFIPLIEGGHFELANYLWQRQGDPYDGILEIPEILIQEQLVSIYRAISKTPEHSTLFNAALELAKQKGSRTEVMSKLGMLSLLYAQKDPGFIELAEKNSIEEIILYLSRIDRKSVLESYFKAQIEAHKSTPETELAPSGKQKIKKYHDKDPALAIANYLLNKDGSINFTLIEDIKTSELFNTLPLSHFTKEHMIYVMNILQDDHEFGMRLEQATIPPKNSQAELIVKKMLHLGDNEIVTKHHVQQVILSGLLCPTRQSSIGSCFATSYVIQLESYRMGLRQTLEDFLAMMDSSSLPRIEFRAGGRVRMEFPLFVDELLESTVFKNDHSLARAREFTLAMMSETKNINKTVKYFDDDLKNPLNEYFFKLLRKNDPKQNNQEIVVGIGKIRQNLFLERCSLAYLPCRQSPSPPHELGARILIDRVTGDLIDTPEKYKALQISIMEEAIANFSNQYTQYQAHLNSITQKLQKWINSPAYMASLFKEDASPLVRLNPEKNFSLSTKVPWLIYESGGLSPEIMKVHCELESSLFMDRQFSQNNREDLSLLIDYVKDLPDCIKKECQENPNMKISYSWPRHTVSLKPAVIYELLEKNSGKSTEEVVDLMIQESHKWGSQEISEGVKEKLMDQLMEKIKPIKLPSGFSQSSSLREAKTIKTYCEAIRENLVNKGVSKTMDNIMSCLYELISANPQIYRPKPSLFLGDTNWGINQEFGYAADPLTGGIILTNRRFGKENDATIDSILDRSVGFSFQRQHHYFTEFNIRPAQISQNK